MAKKRFRNAMSGYNKDEVNKYIDNMMEQYEAKIAEKEANRGTQQESGGVAACI